jgi:hypothetical protein
MELKQQHLVERRKSPRLLVPPDTTLIVGLAFLGEKGKPRTLTARVRDLSATGLGIELPEEEPCGELGERDRQLAVVFKLPGGVVKLRAETARCEPPDAVAAKGNRVAGVRITEIGEGERRLLDEYLRARSESA